MSDENSGTASSAEPMIPKSRLDELIADRNQERQERMFLQQQLAEVARGQRSQAPQVDDPDLEELKQNNPALYKRLKKADLEAKQLRAGFSSLSDQNDRLAYFLEAGDEGKKRLSQVEEILNRERTQNKNFAVTRIGILNWMKGQDMLKKEREQSLSVKKPVEEAHDAPSTDPKFATTIQGGTAPSKVVEKSREERIKDLENVVF